MLMQRLFLIGFVAVSMVVGTACAEAIEVGKPAPAWKDLPGTDGKKHSLADLEDAKVIVVAFTCNHCPVAQAYESRFADFAKTYSDKGVAFVAISVNNLDEDKMPAMIERAKEKGFPFDYLHDESQKIGREYGATKTPQLFVLDADRAVAYSGAFDNKMDEKSVTEHYVADAVDALLAGKALERTKTPAHGCGIKYE